MTDKEQLEEIKRQSEYIELSNAENFIVYQDMKMKKEHYDWLIEQAERVQELEEECAGWKEASRFNDEKLEQQNKRYRDLLTSRIVKQLIRLEDKGFFLPEEDREDFLKLKYAVEALEGEE